MGGLPSGWGQRMGLGGDPGQRHPSLAGTCVGGGACLGPRDPAWPCAQAQACLQLLTLVAPECTVPREPFLQSCQADMAACVQPSRHNCSCATLSEYSRQCSMAGQPVNSWRSPDLCCESRGASREGPGGWWGLRPGAAGPSHRATRPAAVGQCPANQVYRECGDTCVQTCSNPQHSCSSFCTFGCFCPEGEAATLPGPPKGAQSRASALPPQAGSQDLRPQTLR